MSSRRSEKEPSDQELERRVENFLFTRNYPALRDLQISVCEGTVILSGSVSTFHEKQMASSCAQRVAGVLEVINQIDVPACLRAEGAN